jgi:hypothetical protein
MKQLIDAYKDIDVKNTIKRLIPATTLGLLVMSSTIVTADTLNIDDNSVIAMLGIQNASYSEPRSQSYTDDDYESDLVSAIYGEKSGLDFSQEGVYEDYLVRSIENKNYQNTPDYSDDEVYINHLVKIIMK